MFKTKEQVDIHVQTIFKRCRTELERNSRCYHLSKLYKQVGDYESARRYILRYLTVREDSAEAHRLHGQILLSLKQKNKALAEFKCSLELDHHQHDLLPKVCDLLADLDEPLDPDVAQYWVDRTRTHFPNNPAVFRLRERMMTDKRSKSDVSLPKDVEALETLLKAELEIRPSDVALRVRLLQLYMRANRVKDAYHHAVLTEGGRLHSNDLRWYDCLADVYEAYKENPSDWDYVAGKIHVLERLCALSLEEYSTVDCPVTRSNVDCAKCIRSFDQALHSASVLDVISSEREFFHEFLKHMRGQLVFHLATLLFRKAKKDPATWREVSKAAAALLLHAVGFGGNSPPDPQPPWVMRLPEARKTEVARWAVETSFRVSQAGHILMALRRDRGSHFLEQMGNFCAGNWRERVYQRALGTQYDKQMEATSHFLNFQKYAQPVLELPSKSDLQPYDNMAQKQNPGSLHHLVWLGLESAYSAAEGTSRPFLIPPEFHCLAFDGLSLRSNSLKAGGPDSISQLDVDAYLYATIYCSAALKEEWGNKLTLPAGQELPSCLPVALTEPLCSPDQAQWWLTAHQLLTGHALSMGDNKSNSQGDVGGPWVVLQNGLQVIRAQGDHGLGVQLAVKLARTFSKRSKMLSSSSSASSSEVHALEERANIYWASALPLLERLSRNQTIQSRYSQKRMFDYQGQPLSNSDVSGLLEEAHLAMALKMMLDGQDEAAISAFQQLKAPEASFNQALIYKKLAGQEVNGHHREDVTPEMRSRQVALLTKAKECLHLTEERLRLNDIDKSHPLSLGLSNELEDLDTQMDRLNVSSWKEDEKSALNVSKDELSRESHHEREWQQERNWWLSGGRNGTPVESTSTPVRRGTPSRSQSGLSRTLSRDIKQNIENNQSPIQMNDNVRMALDTLPKLIEEFSMMKLSVTEGMIDVKACVEGMKGMVKDDIMKTMQDMKVAMGDMKAQMDDLKEQLNSVKETIPKFKSSRHPHHVTTDGARQAVEGRDAEEDIYVYGDEDEYGDGEEASIAAAAANAAAAAAAAAAAVAAQTQSDKYSAYPGAGYPYQGYPSYRPMGGVQGAAAVAYGAPGAASQAPPQALLPPSIAPFFPLAGASVDPSLLPANAAGMYHSSLRYYGQGALPFSEGQQLPDFRGDAHALSGVPLRPPLLPSAISAHPDGDRGTPQFHSIGSDSPYLMDKLISGPPPPLPVNAVIASSLPTSTPPTQQQLGVSVKQRLGTPAMPSQPVSTSMSTAVTPTTTAPHAFQISMPPQAQILTAPPLDKSSPSVLPLETDKLLSSVPSPLHSAVAIDKSTPKSSKPKALDAASPKTNLSRRSIGEESEEGGEEGDSIDHDPYPDFQPSIPLPALVETHTGEEEEKLLFSSRAKLFRFADKEWKERGVGMLKILHNEDTGKVRIIMRRDQVFKVCANHFITSDMTLSPIASSKGLAWLWWANDFADEEVCLEKLSARFKTIVDAEAFKEAFEKATEIVAEGTPDKRSSKGGKEAKEKVNAALLPSAEAQKAVTSTPESSKSVTTTATEGSKVVLGGFTFVSPPTLKPVDNDENRAANKKKNEEKKTTSKPSIFADFTFGQSSTPTKWGQSSLQITSTPTKTSETPSSDAKTDPPATGPQKEKSIFEASQSMPYSFASLAAETKDKENTLKSGSDFKGFEGAGKIVFGSPPSGDGRKISESEEGEFNPTVEFKPVIPLPQLVEVKTGEEGEDILFERRAKLLRYGDKEWIEFGIGQMKITYNPESKKVRLIMRREQVLKVCCNHFLTEDLQFMPLKTSDRCWTWYALDYPDGTLTAKTLAVKFKTAEEASEFKEVLDSLQKKMEDGKVLLDAEFLASRVKVGKKSDKKTDQGCSINKEMLSGIFKADTQGESKTGNDGAKGVASPLAQTSSSASATKTDATLPTGGFTFWSNKQPFSDPKKPVIFGQESGTPKVSFGDSQKQPLFGAGSATSKSTSDSSTKSEGVTSLAAAFKVEEGSWECKGCYLRNKKDVVQCAACQGMKPGATAVSTPSVTQVPAPETTFKFGIPPVGEGQSTPSFGFKTDPPKPSVTPAKAAEGSLAASFKPEEGSWECGSCYVRNKRDTVSCCACGTTKPGAVAPSNTVTPELTFKFGIPPVGEGQSTPSFGFKTDPPKPSVTPAKAAEGSLAASFKPEEGSWECGSCYVRNKRDTVSCCACGTTKPGAVAPSNTVTPEMTFKFGIPPVGEGQSTPSFGFKTDPPKPSVTPAKPAEGSLAASFKPEEGSWECGSCYLRNKEDKVSCCACGATKPGAVAPSNAVTPSPQPAFHFGVPSATTNANSLASTGASETTTFTAFKDMWGSSKGFEGWGSGTAKPFSSTGSAVETPFKFTFDKQPGEASVPEFTFASNQKYEFHFKGVDPVTLSTSPSTKGSSLKSPDRQISHDESGGSDLYQEEDDGDHVHFQPVIPLPDKVPLHTGEEDEEVLHQHRAKLYRWCGGEWKERGCGDIKLLKHRETGKVRMLMRREQVLKLCLNHYVTDEVTLAPKGDRAWQWTAVDYSEGEMQPEMFSLRFKSCDVAQAFKEAFEEAKLGMNKPSPAQDATTPKASETKPSSASPATSAFSLSKSPAMQTFRFQLDSENTSPRFSLEGLFGGKSPNAESPKSIDSSEIEVVYEAATSEEDRQAAIRLMLPPNFYSYRSKPPCPGCRGCEDDDGAPRKSALKADAKSFATPVKAAESVITSAADSTTKNVMEGKKDVGKSVTKMGENDFGLPFFKVDPGLSFASLAATPSTNSFTAATSNPPSWGSVKSPVFSSLQTKDPKKTSGKESDGEEEEDGGTVETHDPHFEPIIPLPALVNVRTGEEDEVKVFGERSKLYRFDADTKEWKERGVGELKILFHPQNYTYRFIMRRDQVYKLVCNHLITAEFEVKEMKTSDKSYIWFASNYIEEKQSLEQLCARFKSVELAKEFAAVVHRCVADLKSHQASLSLSKSSETAVEHEEEEEYHEEDEDDDDYEYEEVDDEEAMARKVMFEKRGKIDERDGNDWKSIGVGDIKVVYDPDIGCALVTFETAGDPGVIDTLILEECKIKTKDKCCDCTVVDLLRESEFRRFQIQFSSEHAAADFEKAFNLGLSMYREPQEEKDDGD